MELLHMPESAAGALAPLPLLPTAGGGMAHGKTSALKTTSLSRLADLQAYLRQCDDQNYIKNYVKVLSTMPRDLLEDLTRQLRARSAWLSAEEQREYKRAKVLNVMGGPPCVPAAAAAHSLRGLAGGSAITTAGGLGGGGSGGSGGSASAGTGMFGSPGPCSDADAWCSEVLGGGSGGSPAWGLSASGMHLLERLEMKPVPQHGHQAQQAQHQHQHHQQQQQPFMTPVDAQRTKMRVLPLPPLSLDSIQQNEQQQQHHHQQQESVAAAGSNGDAAAGDPGSTQTGVSSEASPGELGAAAGLLDHQLTHISPPDGPSLGAAGTASTAAAAAAAVPTVTPVQQSQQQQQQQQQQQYGGGWARPATLPAMQGKLN